MKKDFFTRVYSIVNRIPEGRVATYGQVATLLGTKDARRVGQALHANPSSSNCPCHRVVFADGTLAPGYAFGGPKEQLRKLQLEGVLFTHEGKADLKRSQWSPQLP